MPKKKEVLVFEEKGEFFTTSMDVAEKFGKIHRDVMRTIKNLGCSDEFSLRNFAHRDFKDSRGKPQKGYNMTRDGFSMLVMGFTGKESFAWKEKYINAFNRLEKLAIQTLKLRTAPERIPHRRENLLSNKAFNEALKEFVEYVEIDGRSSSPQRYYMLFNNLVNHTLFEFPKKLKDIPDKLSIAQLKFSDSTKQALSDELQKGMNAGLYYKDIYKNCKKRAELIASGLGVTPIPMLLENEAVTLIEE